LELGTGQELNGIVVICKSFGNKYVYSESAGKGLECRVAAGLVCSSLPTANLAACMIPFKTGSKPELRDYPGTAIIISHATLP
jgi:hypothetical protein